MARTTPDSDTANEPRYSKRTSRQDIGAALGRAAADIDSLDTVDIELVFIGEAWVNEVAISSVEALKEHHASVVDGEPQQWG